MALKALQRFCCLPLLQDAALSSEGTLTRSRFTLSTILR